MISIIASSAPGLSPLARGTRPRLNAAHKIVRFIPAGAGNTIRAPESITGRPVYPRWRGEHVARVRDGLAASGLSPLARGTLLGVPYPRQKRRFIPAGAGNTHVNDALPPSPTVYPRWRGEHYKRWVRAEVVIGLSPLARGTH